MDDLLPDTAILIIGLDNKTAPLRAKVLHKHAWGCECGHDAYHVELADGMHRDYCASVIRRPN